MLSQDESNRFGVMQYLIIMSQIMYLAFKNSYLIYVVVKWNVLNNFEKLSKVFIGLGNLTQQPLPKSTLYFSISSLKIHN